MILYVNEEGIFTLQMTKTKHSCVEYFDGIQTDFTDVSWKKVYIWDKDIQNRYLC